MKYTWLLFDADNTLYDFNKASHLAFAKVTQEKGIVFSEDLYQIYQKENHKVWKAFEDGQIDAIELRPKRFELFFAAAKIEGDPHHWNKRYLEELINHPILLDGAEALLQQLHGKYKMAIITNGLKEVQRPRFRANEIDQYFETIVVSDEIGVAKPKQAFFDYTFQQIGQPDKSTALVIGDSINSDMKGGINYGLSTCWYNPLEAKSQTAISPKYQIKKLDELHKII